MTSAELLITPGALSLADLRRVNREALRIALDPSCHAAVDAAATTVAQVIATGRVVYGINTGFGQLAKTRIQPDELEELQRSIVLSHAAGVGSLMDESTVRLMLVLKINSLARGYSGIRLEVIQRLVALLNAEVYPAIPRKGSVGASGDLAPLAHMSAVLLGEGEALYRGERIAAGRALEIVGMTPVQLAPKEGLALLNGTQASTAYALQGLFAAENALKSAAVIGAMTVEAARGSRVPFDARIHEIRGNTAQCDMAAVYRGLLETESEISRSHEDCDKVQDPYSLRCQPQVMGACLQQLRFAAGTLLAEANGVSDNPLVFSDSGDILSGGNFHAESVAMAADMLAIALAEIGALAERRIAMLIDSSLSGLPPFLVDNGGVNSGFMIAQVTAAALASENKTLAHPASIDSLPTSANQEDHVSMATFAGRRLLDIVENVSGILAVEWLAAAQGLDFRRPLRPSPPLDAARTLLRDAVPFYDRDRYFAPDIEAARELLSRGVLAQTVGEEPLGF
ncbi:MAG: histidine ammonia-lyase [Haliea sp.]